MKKTISKLLKALFLVAFVLFFYSFESYSQTGKFPAEFHFNSKTGKVVNGDKVSLRFLLTDIKNDADYQYVYSTLSKQDGIKGEVSQFSSSGTAVILTFNNLPERPYKSYYLQKLFISLGVDGGYFDNDFVKTENITSYFQNYEKQKHPELIGK